MRVMDIQLRNVLLKSIPYLLSIVGGMVLFLVTKDNVHNPDWVDLINNIAASLLSIPLVFLLYDYSNYRISRKLNKAMSNTTHDRIDVTLINIVVVLRQMMDMRGKITLSALNKMGDLRMGQIASRIKLRPTHIQTLITLHHELDELIFRNSGGDILSVIQIQSLTNLTHNVQRLINVHRFHQGNRVAAGYAEKIIGFVIDWMDADASIAARFEQLLTGDVTPPTQQSDNINARK